MKRWAENMNQSLVPDFFLNLVNSPKHLMLVLSKIIKKGLSKILKTYNFFFSRTHSLFQKTITKNKSSDQYRFRFPSMFENFLFSKIYCQANFDVLAQIGFWVSLKIEFSNLCEAYHDDFSNFRKKRGEIQNWHISRTKRKFLIK